MIRLDIYVLFLLTVNFTLKTCVELSGNRCYLEPSISLEPSNKGLIHASKNTGLLGTIKQDLEIYTHMKLPIGNMRQGYYCTILPHFADFGNPVAPENVPSLPKGNLYIVDIYLIITKQGATICSYMSISVDFAKCKTTLQKLASSVGVSEPAYPVSGDTSAYTMLLNDDGFISFPLLFSPGLSMTFHHSISDTICGEDIYFSRTRTAAKHFRNTLSENIRQIFYFSNPLLTDPIETEILYINDAAQVALYNNFEEFHAPQLYKILSDEPFSAKFPTPVYSPSAPDPPTTGAWPLYLSLMTIVLSDHGRVKRSILDSFLRDPKVSELAKDSQITSKAFQTVRKNEKVLRDNQKKLKIGLHKIAVKENELVQAVDLSSRRIHQVSLSLGLALKYLSRKTEQGLNVERLENLFALAGDQKNSIQMQINSLITPKNQICTSVMGARMKIICNNHYPTFKIINNEIIVLMSAQEHQMTKHLDMTCLPFSNKKIFTHSGMSVTLRQGVYYTEDKQSFKEECLLSTANCQNLYETRGAEYRFGDVCQYITNLKDITINCFEMIEVSTHTGTRLKIGDTPVTVSLSELPLSYGNATLTPSDILTSITPTIIPIYNTTQEKDLSKIFTPGAPAPEIKKTGPEQSLDKSFQEFIAPEGIQISHVFAGLSGIFLFSSAFLVCLICCRPELAKYLCQGLTRLAACCFCCRQPSEGHLQIPTNERPIVRPDRHRLPRQQSAPGLLRDLRCMPLQPLPAMQTQPQPQQQMMVPLQAAVSDNATANTDPTAPLLQQQEINLPVAQRPPPGSVSFQNGAVIFHK